MFFLIMEEVNEYKLLMSRLCMSWFVCEISISSNPLHATQHWWVRTFGQQTIWAKDVQL